MERSLSSLQGISRRCERTGRLSNRDSHLALVQAKLARMPEDHNLGPRMRIEFNGRTVLQGDLLTRVQRCGARPVYFIRGRSIWFACCIRNSACASSRFRPSRSPAIIKNCSLCSASQDFGGGPRGDTLDRSRESVTNSGKVRGVNLRGLGAGATLILINGRRLAPGGSQALFVDISSIPLAAVERIEVQPDGASALYGADAIDYGFDATNGGLLKGTGFSVNVRNVLNRGTPFVNSPSASAMTVRTAGSRDGCGAPTLARDGKDDQVKHHCCNSCQEPVKRPICRFRNSPIGVVANVGNNRQCAPPPRPKTFIINVIAEFRPPAVIYSDTAS